MEAPKADADAPDTSNVTTVNVVYHFSALTADGYAEVKTVTRSVRTGRSTTNITKGTAGTYVTTKTVVYDGTTYVFDANLWTYEDGSSVVFPLTMTFDDAKAAATEVSADGKTATTHVYVRAGYNVRYSAVYTFEYLGTDGEMTSYSFAAKTTTGADVTAPTETQVTKYQGTKIGTGDSAYYKTTVGNVAYLFTGWQDADGNAFVPGATLTYDEVKAAAEASDDGIAHFVYTAQYEEHGPVTVTITFNDVRHADGTIENGKTHPAQTMEYGNGFGFNSKTMQSVTGLIPGTSFDYMGYRYTFTGNYLDEDGNIVDASNTIWFYNKPGETEGNTYYVEEDVDLVFVPEWESERVRGLDYLYIDNISTGSGSFSNADAFAYRSTFGSLTHTFSNPEDASPTLTPHYRFQYWQGGSHVLTDADGSVISTVDDSRNIYRPGTDSGTVTFFLNSGTPVGSTMTYTIYAMWQPSVTVVYHDADGTTLETVESFDDDIAVYDAYAKEADENGNAFEGWYDAEGNRLSDNLAYELPAITHENGTATSYDVYARYYPAVTVSTEGGTYVYDGQPHAATATAEVDLDASSPDITGNDYSDYTIEVSTSATATNVAESPAAANEASITLVVKHGDDDVTDSVKVVDYTGCTGEVIITPAPITVITESGSKVYDGTALTAGGTITGLVNGETADLVVSGSQTDVGSSTNTYSGIDWLTAIMSNYELRAEELGVLEVTPRPVTVTIVGNNSTVMYNGTQQSVTGYTTTISDPLFNASYIRHTGGSTAAGTAVGTYAMGLSADQFTSTNPNFDVTFQVTDGQLTITPAPPIGGGGTVTPTPGDPTPTDPTPTDPTPAPTTTPAPTNVTPAPTTNISGNATPLAGLGRGIWSLFDLICTIVAVLLSLILLPGLFRRKKDDEEEEDEQAQGDAVMAAQASAAKKDEDEEKNYKMHKPLRVLSLIPAIGSVLLFIFTQDLTLPMAIFDNWSLWFAIIALVQIVVAFFARKKKEDDDEDDEDEQMTEPVFIPEA